MDKQLYDWGIFIIWNPNSKIIAKIEEHFHNNIEFIQTNNDPIEIKLPKIQQLYPNFKIEPQDLRCLHPFKIIVVKTLAKNQYFYRSEGYKLCNTEMLQFKLKYRKEFDYSHFHSTDHLEEVEQVIQAFDLPLKTHKKIIPVDKLYHFVHEEDAPYEQGKFKIVPLKDSCVVKYLQGYPEEYLSKPKSFDIRPQTFEYLANFKPHFFNQNHDLAAQIEAVPYQDKYIITDGMHRTSHLYYYGDRHIVITIPDTVPAYIKHVKSEQIQAPLPNSHLENVHQFIFELRNQNIRFVIIRGLNKIETQAKYEGDSDFDIIIHPQDYNKFLSSVDSLIKNNILSKNEEKLYHHPEGELWYRSFKTQGSLGDKLPNQCYYLDTYNCPFFFLNATHGAKFSEYFTNYLFDNKVSLLHLFKPNLFAEIMLILGRALIDRQGNWSPKHKNKLKFLLNNHLVNQQEFDIFFKQSWPNKLPFTKKQLLDYVR